MPRWLIGSRILTSLTLSPRSTDLLALVFVPTLKAQDVGYDIQHVVFLDNDIGHGGMRGLHPYPERSSRDPRRVGDFPEAVWL